MTYSGTPIQSIPPEILARIFVECLSGNCFPSPAKSEAPLLLGRVCSYWRSVALSTCELWTGIVLGKRYLNYFDLKKDAMSVIQWRIRAGPSSRLSYNLHYRRSGDGGESWTDLMNTIIHQHKFWRRIQGLLPPSIANQILSVIPDTPMLEYLNIGTRTDHALDINLPLMPCLQKLVITTDEALIQFGACGSPSLREVTIDEVCTTLTLDVCWLFLSHCPNLEVFYAHCYPYDHFTLHHNENIHHARLTYLHLDSKDRDPGPLLDKIEAPDLLIKYLSLQYHNTPVDDRQGWPHPTSFLNRSKCQLTHLVLGVRLMSDDDIVNCLRATPGLKSFFVVQFPLMTNATITTLKLGPQQSGEYTLCPELEFLCFYYCMRCSLKALEEMIISRCTNVTTKLRKVSLYHYDIAPYEQLLVAPRIVQCIEEGLQLIIGTSNTYEGHYRTDDPLTVGWR